MNTQIPVWLDRQEYPFTSHHFLLPMGKMHYVDEGQGETILMLHGNPTWSFLYRHAIKGLSPDYRCVAPDYIGFGLSDKPWNWSYLPQEQAHNVARLIDHLQLKEFNLVVQDWGGPIGLSYALNHPENVKRLVIMNTWMWSVRGQLSYEFFSRLMGGSLGRYLVNRHNFFARSVMKFVTSDHSALDPATHQQYIAPLANAATRKGAWAFPHSIIGSSDWLESLWAQRERLRHIPALLLWGMGDPSFRDRELRRFQSVFDAHYTLRLENVGHFVQEELKQQLAPLIRAFLTEQPLKEGEEGQLWPASIASV